MAITLPAELEPLATDVALRVAGADPGLVLNQLRHAIRDFCTRSTAWRETVTVTTVVNTTDYTLTGLPSGTMAAWLIAVTRNGIPLGKWALPYGSQTLRSGDPAASSGPPAIAAMPSPGKLRLSPKPDQVYTLAVDVALTPSADILAVAFPTGLLTLYHDAIVAGALARLYMVPNTPFYSAALSTVLTKAFSRGIAAARIATEATLSRGLQPVLPFPRPAGSLPA